MATRLRFKTILYGDDEWGTIIDETAPYKHQKTGIEMKSYLIIPSLELIEAYPEQLKKQGALNVPTEYGPALWVHYPMVYVTDVNPSRRNAFARIDCGFDGRDTPYTKKYAELKKAIEDKDVELERYKTSNYVKDQENKMLMNDTIEYAKKLAELNDMLGGKKRDAGYPENLPPLPQQ